MIIGTGLDIIEIARLAAALERHGDRFSARVFTPAEQAHAAGLGRGQVSFYAGRWAAKEAVAKALGCGVGPDCGLRDIEVLPDDRGKPVVALQASAVRTAADRGIARWHLSITHEQHYAVAQVIAEA